MFDLLSLGVGTARISTPYVAGALGGTLSERSGVVNIALEGLMLAGAFGYAWAAWGAAKGLGAESTIAWWLAPAAGMAAGVAAALALSAVHVFATVYCKAEHIISGLAINILALGGSNFLLKAVFGSASTSDPCPQIPSPAPFSGAWAPANGLFHPLLWLVAILPFASHWLLFRSRLGLRLRAVGENPAAADSLGVHVGLHRATGAMLGGACAGLGGVWLASDQGRFTTNMTGGRGYIALAAMIVGKWRPKAAALACLGFGLAEALQTRMQTGKSAGADSGWFARMASAVPNELVQALPYLVTIVVIAGFVGRSTPPAAAGVAFEKERGA